MPSASTSATSATSAPRATTPTQTPTQTPPLVLCVAGTDPSGGAGLTADARVCAAHRCWPLSIVTAVVAQSTLGVTAFEPLPPVVVAAQWDALWADCAPHAIKLGMLAAVEVVTALTPRLVAARAQGVPVVYDPVLRSGHGAALSGAGLVAAIRAALRAGAVDVLTPNIPEAEALLGNTISSPRAMGEAAAALVSLGARGVLLKGGHLDGSGDAWAWRPEATAEIGEITEPKAEVTWLANADILPGLDVHGTGCHLSTALACGLAQGLALGDAARAARAFLTARLHATRWRPGKGREVLG